MELEKVVGLTKKYGVKTAFFTDLLFDPPLAAKQGKFLAKLKRWYTPYEVLKMATSGNAELKYWAFRLTARVVLVCLSLILVDSHRLE